MFNEQKRKMNNNWKKTVVFFFPFDITSKAFVLMNIPIINKIILCVENSKTVSHNIMTKMSQIDKWTFIFSSLQEYFFVLILSYITVEGNLYRTTLNNHTKKYRLSSSDNLLSHRNSNLNKKWNEMNRQKERKSEYIIHRTNHLLPLSFPLFSFPFVFVYVHIK